MIQSKPIKKILVGLLLFGIFCSLGILFLLVFKNQIPVISNFQLIGKKSMTYIHPELKKLLEKHPLDSKTGIGANRVENHNNRINFGGFVSSINTNSVTIKVGSILYTFTIPNDAPIWKVGRDFSSSQIISLNDIKVGNIVVVTISYESFNYKVYQVQIPFIHT